MVISKDHWHQHSRASTSSVFNTLSESGLTVLKRAATANGISTFEKRLLKVSARLFQALSNRTILPFYLTIGDDIHDMDEVEARKLIRDILNRLAIVQKRDGLVRPIWLVVIEVQPSFHAHIIFLATRSGAKKMLDFCEKLNVSHHGGLKTIKTGADWQRLVSYHLKEAEYYDIRDYAQPSMGSTVRRRKLPLQLESDRVRVSVEVKSKLINSGWIEPWRKSYASKTKLKKRRTS